MAHSWAFACTWQGAVGPGLRCAIVDIGWVNNYVAGKTLDVSSTNADSITLTSPEVVWLGFSEIKNVTVMPPHIAAGLGYIPQISWSGTTLTLAMTYCDYDAGADGPMIELAAAGWADNVHSKIMIWGN